MAALAAGSRHVCAGFRDVFGVVFRCAGLNTDGQTDIPCGLNTYSVINNSKGVKSVFAGFRHTCMLNGRGLVYCFGWNK